MIAITQCLHCQRDFEVEAEAEQETCPHCARLNRIIAVRVGAAKPAAPRPVPMPPVPSPAAPRPAWTPPVYLVEERLDDLGRVFLWSGIIGAVICGGGLFWALNEHDSLAAWGCLLGCLGALFQGILLHTLFQALSEIIRLLRKHLEARP